VSFKAIELDSSTRQRTGRELALEAETRDAAIAALLTELAVPRPAARVDPTRTLVEVDGRLWTIVAVRPAATREAPSLRRGGAKHKHVR
jgi:hypothetical protein